MSVRIPLKNGHTLDLNGSDIIIDETIGMGGSSIVYNAHYFDQLDLKHRIRLKELFPQNCGCVRAEDGSVTGEIPQESKERFCRASQTQLRLYEIENLTNSTFPVQGPITANGTIYQIMEYLNGECLSNLCVSGIHDYLGILYQTAEIIVNYHRAGYLHLDIKPDNVYCLKTSGGYKVMLFDFDSIIRREDCDDPGTILISTRGYSAPEITDRKRISEATDFFSIGAMLFEWVFGRTPDKVRDCSSFSRWNASDAAGTLFGTDEKFFEKLCAFFKKTISIYTADRYKSGDELLNAIAELRSSSDVKLPYIEHRFSLPFGVFIGRGKELAQISNAFNESRNVVLSGFGGVGKSVLAANYARIHIGEYDSVIFAQYSGSFTSLFCDDSVFSIANFSRKHGESDAAYYDRKMECFMSLCSERILLILDNCDDCDPDTLDKWLDIPCRKIITTRNTRRPDNAVSVEIYGLTECMELFRHYCTKPLSADEENAVSQLITLADHHTLTIELMAKLISHSVISPCVLLERFSQFEIEEIDDANIRQGKDRRLSNRSIQKHIDALFDLSGFSEEERVILAELSVISIKGIDTALFMEWCGIKSRRTINALIEKGFITEDPVLSMISMHPLIIDRVRNYLKPDVSQLETLMRSLTYYIDFLPAAIDSDIVTHRIAVCESIISRFSGVSPASVNFLAQFIITRTQMYRSSQMVLPLFDVLENNKSMLGTTTWALLELAIDSIRLNDRNFYEDNEPLMEKLLHSVEMISGMLGTLSSDEAAKAGTLCLKITEDFCLSVEFGDDKDLAIWNYAEKFLLYAYNTADSNRKCIARSLCKIYGDFTSPLMNAVKENQFTELSGTALKIYNSDGTAIEPDYYDKQSDLIDAMRMDEAPYKELLAVADETMEHWRACNDELSPWLRSQIIDIYSQSPDRVSIADELMIDEDNGYNYLQLAENAFCDIPPRVTDAKKNARLSVAYWKERLSEDICDNCGDIFKAYSLLIKMYSGDEKESWTQELIREADLFIDERYRISEKSVAEEFISLSRICERHRTEFVVFAAAFAEPENFRTSLEEQKQGAENASENRSQGYLWNELNRIIHGDFSDRYRYYAFRALSEYYYDADDDRAADHFRNAAEAGRKAFGLDDYRTAYSMNRYDEISSTSFYSPLTNYRKLAEYEYMIHFSNYSTWFEYIGKYLDAGKTAEAQSMAEKMEKSLDEGEERTKCLECGIMECLCDYYRRISNYPKMAECTLKLIRICDNLNISHLLSPCTELIKCQETLSSVNTMWECIEEKFRKFDAEHKLDLALEAVDIADGEYPDVKIHWLLLSQGIENLPDDYKRNERIRVCDQLSEHYEKLGDMDNVRKQNTLKHRLSPDRIYT